MSDFANISGYGNNSTNRTQGKAPASNGSNIDAVYEDESTKNVSVDDFLNLMITQLKNQDFMNPMDDTQYVTQLAQFATMQQMQELAFYQKSNFTMSLTGQNVTVAKLSIGGEVEKITGPVEKIVLANNEFSIYVKGKPYKLNQLMEVHTSAPEGDGSLVDPSKYTIIPTTKTETSIGIEWPVPTEDVVVASGLKYSVYYSTSPDFNTVEEVKSGIRVGAAEREDLTQETITGLSPGTTYFINVVVKDANGKESVYSKSVVSTKEKATS